MEPGSRTTLASARRVIVKVGSALAIDQSSGTIRDSWLEMLARDIARLCVRGQDVVLVSSGAVAIGRHALGLGQRKLLKKDRQAAAAVGQMQLTRAHREIFARHRMTAAQVLLTLDDTTERRRMQNARATLTNLLTFRAIPVLNENDAIATSAASFGDNDHLAASVARLIGSDTLVLLSDVGGLYTADPHGDPDASLIKEVHEITPEIVRMAGGARSDYSAGGMVSKLAAARIAVASGCVTIIADGREAYPLSAIDAGKPCTWFHPSNAARVARKRRIGNTLRPNGVIVVDPAAAMQVRSGNSLCVGGVQSFDGDFSRGDAVIIRDVHGSEFARGLTIWSSAELRCVTRQHKEGARIASGLNRVVDRDDLAFTD
ncbi:glutamate 5-kinase [Bradyrhizobium sp. IAR9]|uniref:glutamate 5-kinase n=1 Tax=Bradyrhizobium sp. IAR9 TaxID=2663841 RepID=UPI00390C4701